MSVCMCPITRTWSTVRTAAALTFITHTQNARPNHEERERERESKDSVKERSTHVHACPHPSPCSVSSFLSFPLFAFSLSFSSIFPLLPPPLLHFVSTTISFMGFVIVSSPSFLCINTYPLTHSHIHSHSLTQVLLYQYTNTHTHTHTNTHTQISRHRHHHHDHHHPLAALTVQPTGYR
jgi:hypothetical protein